jgi:gamma-glutamyltranspeptidase
MSANTVFYRLRQVDRDGTASYSPTVQVTREKAGNTRLTDIYPNPFNPSSTVHFILAQTGTVHLSMMDATGKTLRSVIHGEEMMAGSHAVTLNAPDLPSGNYFIVLRTAAGTSMQPVTLLK